MTETTEKKWERDYKDTLARSRKMEGAIGAIAFAVLEMFRRGGLNETEIENLHQKMKKHFKAPSNTECNAICKMVETRLTEDQDRDLKTWY